MPEQFLHGVEVIQSDDGIRPISTATSSVIGIVGTAIGADDDLFPYDTPVLIGGPRAAANLGTGGGTLRDAYTAMYAQGASVAVVIRVQEGADDAATLANVVGDTAAQTGVWAFEQARSLLDVTPRILVAPGFTSSPAADPANPVTTYLIAVAEKLRAVVVSDGPNTNEADAKLDRAKWGSDRLMIIDPAVIVFDITDGTYVTRPASGYAAGLLAKRDLEKGFWWSPSNQVINGISGTARPISFHLSSSETEANRMNEAEVTTIIRRDGFRLWGNRGAGADAQWAFLSVRRTADVIYESIERAHLWAMDRPMSAQLILDLRDSVQGFGQGLVNQGALLGFNVWLDPELNTEANLKAGKLYLNFDFEPPAPLEHLVFRAERNGTYYDELIASVSAAA
jgi:phage tail sheath protein FI